MLIPLGVLGVGGSGVGGVGGVYGPGGEPVNLSSIKKGLKEGPTTQVETGPASARVTLSTPSLPGKVFCRLPNDIVWYCMVCM